MSNGSDINVGNIEEDINELKILLFQDRLTNYGKRKLIDYYENKIARQKQINEEHQKINGELREKVKELEDKYILEKVAKEEVEELLEDSIPKQKIKKLMEKEKLPLTIVGGRNNSKTLAYGIRLGKIKACEELLQ